MPAECPSAEVRAWALPLALALPAAAGVDNYRRVAAAGRTLVVVAAVAVAACIVAVVLLLVLLLSLWKEGLCIGWHADSMVLGVLAAAAAAVTAAAPVLAVAAKKSGQRLLEAEGFACPIHPPSPALLHRH